MIANDADRRAMALQAAATIVGKSPEGEGDEIWRYRRTVALARLFDRYIQDGAILTNVLTSGNIPDHELEFEPLTEGTLR